MDKSAKKTSPDLLHLVAWAHPRRKQLLGIAGAIVAVGAIAGFILLHGKAQETNASEALSNLRLPSALENATAADARPFLAVANEYPKTDAGGRAMLLAGQILFEAGKFADARAQFERYMQSHTDYPLVNQALVAIAACLEAEGKIAEAIARYYDFTQRHPSEPTTFQARCSLARLYELQNKHEQALDMYEQLARSGNDAWSQEARMRGEQLLATYMAPKMGMRLGPAVDPSLEIPNPLRK